jgi:hypothetical protein
MRSPHRHVSATWAPSMSKRALRGPRGMVDITAVIRSKVPVEGEARDGDSGASPDAKARRGWTRIGPPAALSGRGIVI